MKDAIVKLSVFLCAMLFAGMVLAADQDQDRDRDRLNDDNVYGWQLMTPKERDEYREKIRSLNTEQEREAFRNEHHKQMQERAREQGVTLPESPMTRQHGGAGPGSGGMGGGGGGMNR